MTTPNNCGYSIDFDGVYVCRLKVLPCSHPCPIDKEYDMSEKLKEIFDGHDRDGDAEEL